MNLLYGFVPNWIDSAKTTKDTSCHSGPKMLSFSILDVCIDVEFGHPPKVGQ